MAPDHPSDLIQDIKIRLRQAAGVPSYDPGDPALPSFPSVADAVNALDLTLPDYLRCKRCHGGLVRGINSTLCIFCGAEQRGEGISQMISFNSTAAYLKFLQSLDLDGSEMVNLEAEPKESSKGQDSPKGGVTLAKFLDLELRWPGEREEFDNNSSNEAPSQVALVSLSGVDLDNFFSDQNNEVSSRSNTSHSTNNAPQVSALGANSFSLDFDTFLSGAKNQTTSSDQNGTLEQFMPREQSVNTHANLSSKSQKLGISEGRKSLDGVNSSADAKGSDSDDPFTDWETDFQSASSATFEFNFKQIDPLQTSEHFLSAEPRTNDIFHNPIDYQSANYETVGPESKQIDPSQNSSNFQPDNSASLAKESKTNDLFHNFSTDFSPIVISKSDQNTYIGHNSSKDDDVRDLTHEVDQLASRNDWFQDDMWSQISTTILKESDKLESLSNTSIRELKNEEKETTSVSVRWTQDDLWQSSANEIDNTVSLNHHDDDLFDDWQDFTAATNASGNSPILLSVTGDKVSAFSSEENSGDLEDLEFGCFIQSDSFSDSLNDLQSGGDSTAHRTNQSNEKIGEASASDIYSSSDIVENIPDASDLDPSRNKVDMLLAQMPDLSFMLEESLYIPKNPRSSELNT